MIRSLKNLYHLFAAILAVIVYRCPARDLVVIGVTGTDGKSTTTHLIASILKSAGKKVALTSTIGTLIDKKEEQFGLHVTTPSPFQVQSFLRKAVDQKITHVILEASSHGLDQNRLFGCNFYIGILTNVTHEHLDYHGSWEKYLEAKGRLFRNVKVAILNADDPSISYFRRIAKSAKIITYGVKNGDINPNDFKFKTKLLGIHNIYNCLAAISCALALKIEDQVIREGIESFEGIAGRLEEIAEGQPFKIYVDFAHTPAAFEVVLSSLKEGLKGKLIHVFGCTGKRDKLKRPKMGEVSSNFADQIILTTEDTYGEDPNLIFADIEKGIANIDKYQKIADRKAAIKKAIEIAKKDDIVIITGVGHQKTLNLGNKEIPWSDQEQVKNLLKEKHE